MKVSRSIKEMPWPEYQGIAGADLQVTGTIVGGLLVLTITLNRAHILKQHPYMYQVSEPDKRLIINADRRDWALLERTGGRARRRLPVINCVPLRSCYPEIDTRTEALIAAALGVNESNNHYMPELVGWLESSHQYQKEQAKLARGEIPDDAVNLCPEEKPDGLWDFVRRNILANDHTIIYKRGGVRGTCSLCGRSVRAKGKHFRQGCYATCPNCGEYVYAVLEGSSLWKADYVDNVVTIQRGDGGTVWFRLWHIIRDYSVTYDGGADKWMIEAARYCIRGDKAAQWNIFYKEHSLAGRCFEYRLDSWTRTSRVLLYDGVYTFCPIGLDEAVAGTKLQYANLRGYMHDPEIRCPDVLMYAINFARYPVMEFLYKRGYKSLVQAKVRHGLSEFNRNAILWQRKKLRECIRFPLRLLKLKDPCEWTMDDVESVRRLWQIPGMTDKALPDILSSGIPHDLYNIFAHGRPEKTLAYLRRVAATRERETIGSVARIYRDYLGEVAALNLNTTDESILYPPDLYARHAETARLVEYEKNKDLYDKIAKRAKKLSWLSWTYGGLTIRPATSPAELKEEGAALHHCVGGYAQRMADGETAIFFIRREPDKPYFTLELKGKNIVQCRGKNNIDYHNDPDVAAFVDRWYKEIVVEQKKKKRNSNKNTAVTAA